MGMLVVVEVVRTELSRKVGRGAAVSAVRSHAVAGGVVGIAAQQRSVQVESGGVTSPVL